MIALWYDLFGIRKKSKNYVEEQSIYKQNINRLGEKFGLIHKEILFETHLNIDGTSVEKLFTEIEVIKGPISSRGHYTYLPGGSSFSEVQIEINGSAKGHEVLGEVIKNESNVVVSRVNFTPLLKTGEKANYTRICKYGLGAFLMTKNEVFKNIGEDKWGLSEPY